MDNFLKSFFSALTPCQRLWEKLDSCLIQAHEYNHPMHPTAHEKETQVTQITLKQGEESAITLSVL